MGFRMKTTLIIPDAIMRQLKQEAVRRKTTISALVTQALRQFLDEDPGGGREPAPLPVFSGGRALVDVANREALYDAMERD